MQRLSRAFLLGTALGAALVAGSGCSPGAPEADGARQAGAAHAAVREALRNVDPLDRARALADALRPLGAADAEEVRRAYRDAQFSVALGDRILLAYWWGHHDPKAALEWARKDLQSPQIVEIVMEEYAAVDPDAARRELSEIPTQRKVALGQSLVRGWYRSGKPGLTAYLNSLEYGIQQQELVNAYLRALMDREGQEEVRSWALSIPEEADDRYREMAFQRVAAVLTALDPEIGLSWALEHFQGPSGTGLLQIVATPWARTDGLAALTRISRVPDGSQKLAAVNNAFRSWLSVDRAAALDFAARSADEPWFDLALALYARITAKQQGPAEGLKLAAKIRNLNRRQDTHVKIARFWRGSDEAAVRQWLKTVDLPEIAQQQIWYDPPGGGADAIRRAEAADALGKAPAAAPQPEAPRRALR